MRRLPGPWARRFDAVINLYTSFGFFENPADDVIVIAEFSRVLARGGVFIFHAASRDGVMSRFLASDWWETQDKTLVAQQRAFDPLSGVLTIDSTLRRASGRSSRRQHRIRLYTPTQIAELCRRAGLIVEEAFDSFSTRPLTRRSTEMLLVARKQS
jgi:SAM-dependent methyltransferase